MVNGRETRTDLEPEIPANQKLKQRLPELPEAKACREKGGKWDAINGVCILPKEDEPRVEVTPTTPETFKDVKTEELSGIVIDGKTYLGLSPADVQQIARRKLEKTQLPEGTAPVGTAQAQAEEQARLQAAIGQIGQVGQLTEAEQAKINVGQAVTAGTVGQIPKILATAGGFAAGGFLAGGPLGAAIGAGVGILAGIAGGVLGNIKEQQRGELQAADVELKNARTNMRQLAMLASQDPARAEVYIEQYNQQLTRVIQARKQTKAEVQGNLNSFMEDGREQLADFDSFLQPGGIADIYGQKLEVSLQTKVPLTEADFITEFGELQ